MTEINWPTPEKWVEALESGEYGKGKRQLTDGKGAYCCLGVLCEMTDDIGPARPAILNGSEMQYFKKGPRRILIGVGFIDGAEAPEYLSIKIQEELASLNDSNDTFAEVIDYIKTNIIEKADDASL